MSITKFISLFALNSKKNKKEKDLKKSLPSIFHWEDMMLDMQQGNICKTCHKELRLVIGSATGKPINCEECESKIEEKVI